MVKRNTAPGWDLSGETTTVLPFESHLEPGGPEISLPQHCWSAWLIKQISNSLSKFLAKLQAESNDNFSRIFSLLSHSEKDVLL